MDYKTVHELLICSLLAKHLVSPSTVRTAWVVTQPGRRCSIHWYPVLAQLIMLKHEQPNVDAELAAAAKAWEAHCRSNIREGGRPVVEIRDALADAMWNKVGIFRNEEGITEALKEIEQLIEDYKLAM